MKILLFFSLALMADAQVPMSGNCTPVGPVCFTVAPVASAQGKPKAISGAVTSDVHMCVSVDDPLCNPGKSGDVGYAGGINICCPGTAAEWKELGRAKTGSDSYQTVSRHMVEYDIATHKLLHDDSGHSYLMEIATKKVLFDFDILPDQQPAHTKALQLEIDELKAMVEKLENIQPCRITMAPDHSSVTAMDHCVIYEGGKSK